MFKTIFNHLKFQWYKYVMEVIVVIVGILIAYNVEQWTDTRHNKEREVEMLKEFKAALSEDFFLMNSNIKAHEISIQSSKTILRVIKDDLLYHDSLDVYFSWTHAFSGWSGRVGPVEQLKNSSLEIVSNDTLRLKIISMYDEYYPRLKKIEEAVVRDYEQLRDFDRLYFDAYDPEGISTTKNLKKPFWGTMRPTRFSELKTNPEYAALLRVKISNQMGLLRGHYKPIARSLSVLLDQIDQELKRLE